MDARIEIDRILTAYFKYNKRVEYSDLHEDYAIAYINGQQRRWGYGPDSDVKETTSRVIRDVEDELQHLEQSLDMKDD